MFLGVSICYTFFRNGMLRESQLSTRNMVKGVTEEFWKMVNDSVYDQALQFKSKIGGEGGRGGGSLKAKMSLLWVCDSVYFTHIHQLDTLL